MSIQYPQTVFDANTIATAISNEWSLSGLLAKVQNVDTSITSEGVWIFPHQNPEGVSKRIAVLVRSVTPRENVVEHPKFDEVRYTYEIWCHYVLETIDEDTWENAESLIQQMQDEVLRILQTLYHPAQNIGVFFTTNRRWENRDDYTQQQQQINRVLNFTLTRLRSRNVSVPVGYGGALAFDITNSDAFNTTGINYIYTEAYHVEADEGWDTSEEVITGNPYGQGVPVQFTTKFAGFIQFELYPKKADIGSTYTSQLNQLYQILTSNPTHTLVNEIPRIYLIQTVQDLETVPSIMTDNIAIRPVKFFRVYDQEQIVKIRIIGKIFKPSTVTFA